MTQNPIALPQPEMEGASQLPSHDFSLLSILQFVPAVSLSSPMDPVLDSTTTTVGSRGILSIKRCLSAGSRIGLAGFLLTVSSHDGKTISCSNVY